MRPDSKLKERHTQKTHAAFRPDVDAEQANTGFEEAVFEDPTRKDGKQPDPQWQERRQCRDRRVVNSADKVFDGE